MVAQDFGYGDNRYPEISGDVLHSDVHDPLAFVYCRSRCMTWNVHTRCKLPVVDIDNFIDYCAEIRLSQLEGVRTAIAMMPARNRVPFSRTITLRALERVSVCSSGHER